MALLHEDVVDVVGFLDLLVGSWWNISFLGGDRPGYITGSTISTLLHDKINPKHF